MLVARSLAFVGLFYAWSAAVSLALLPLLLAPRRLSVRLMGVWSVGIIWLLRAVCDIRVELRGARHVPTGPALVAPKHQCMFDVFAQFSWLPYACFVFKKELRNIPFFGWYAVKARMVAVDRDGHSAALKKMLRDARLRVREGRQLVIFPEGTRVDPGVRGDYKPGIAALYRDLGLPVHPVAVNSGEHWPAHGFLRHPGTIVFEYLEPIPPGLKRDDFMRLLEDRIEEASARLAGQ